MKDNFLCFWFLLYGLFFPLSSICGAKSDFEFVNETVTDIAFGSCHKNKYADSDLWSTIFNPSEDDNNDNGQTHRPPPQVWLWTGDAVYPPMRKIAPPDVLAAEYRRMNSDDEDDVVGYKRAIEQRSRADQRPLRIFGTWDDHDYGGNDMGEGMPEREARADLFFDFLGLPRPTSSPATYRQGVYSSVTMGEAPRQVKIILLDTRWHRSQHCLPNIATRLPGGSGIGCLTRWFAAGVIAKWCTHKQAKSQRTVLGAEQWEWLERELVESQAAVHIVVSSIQLLSTNPAMEGWGHFPAERQRLIRLLTTTSTMGRRVVVLSGDVHFGEIADPAAQLPNLPATRTRWWEVTSSGLTHACTKHIYGPLCQPLLNTFHQHRSDKGAYYVGRNFGQIHIDWEKQALQVALYSAVNGSMVLSTDWQSFGDASLETKPWTEEELEQIPECLDGHLKPYAATIAIGTGLLLLLTQWGKVKKHK